MTLEQVNAILRAKRPTVSAISHTEAAAPVKPGVAALRTRISTRQRVIASMARARKLKADKSTKRIVALSETITKLPS